MDRAVFEEELKREQFLDDAQEKYGSCGRTQAKRLAAEARALYAGGELCKADKEGFMNEMMEIFMIAKEEANTDVPIELLIARDRFMAHPFFAPAAALRILGWSEDRLDEVAQI